MSLLGKIQALFADKERTQAIFPLTKVKAISDDDGTGLDAILDRAVYTDDGVIETSVASRDADTLGGLPAATYATTSFVKNEILNSQVGGDAGEIDLSGLATKDELNSKVNKTGDTMTGDLTINSGDWPSIFLKATGATNAGYLEGSKNSSGSLCLWSQNAADDNATRRGLRLINSEGNSSIANALILSDLAEGVTRKDYKIYGEHNKPTAADVGALPISGGTATGPIAVNGNDNTVTMGTGANDVYIRNTVANKYLQLKNDGTLSYSNNVIYHAGNKPTPADIGAAASSHNHAAGNITSGTLALARGGTGMTTASVSSASNSYHYAHFAKFGNLVVCTLHPATNRNSNIYESSLTVPSGYRPKSAVTFDLYSNVSKTAGGTGVATVAVGTNGNLRVLQAHGVSVAESTGTYCWISA